MIINAQLLNYKRFSLLEMNKADSRWKKKEDEKCGVKTEEK